ncbi:group-specific protein [Jeotgalibacillus terrae]|uniref:Group-specific protein n=1 Tax=Jeotgalibacillus terrae TaxID=587735 RepID=A0ABW5ZHE1_9BACL|nr:group-specific protein [Jeotgalibacillus terrae]MBM7579380.1 H+/gluconate symporter-like permease [Jeotgalibacillus terrae]
MDTGWIISLGVMAVWITIIMAVMIPMHKKHIVKENGKINYKKTKIFLRWNRFDTMTLILAIYTILCIQALNMLLSSGFTIENHFVQFFTNQGQAWVIVVFAYLVTRVTATLKSIKAHWGDELEAD